MWVELAKATATAGVVVGLVGLIVKSQSARIGRMENSLKCKVNVKMCNIHYDELKEDLNKGSERFDKLIAEQKMVGETLARLDERIQLLLDRPHG